MATLFAIQADLIALNELCEELPGGEMTPEAEAAFDAWAKTIEGDEGRKLDGYCGLVKQLESEAAVAKAEAEQYAMKARARDNRVKWLKDRMKGYLEFTGRKKMVTATLRTVTIQTNGGKLAMTQTLAANPNDMTAEEILHCPDKYFKVRTVLDAEAIRKDLEAGEPVNGASLEPRGTHLRIR